MGWRLCGQWMGFIYFFTIKNSTRLTSVRSWQLPHSSTPELLQLLNFCSPSTSAQQIQNPSLEFANHATQIAMWEKIQAPIPNRLSRPLRS